MKSYPVLTRLLLWATLLLAPAVLGTEWYVAPDGADSAAGTEAEPLATLEQALLRARPGDTILLRRGGTWRIGSLSVDRLTIAAYGTGEPPTLTGSLVITLAGTWAQNPVVRTGALAERALGCYVNGRFVRLARYPDTGFLRVDNDDDPDRIVDEELLSRPGVAPGRWTGAQVRWRRWSWWWETRPITAHDPADTLSLGPEGRFQDPFSDPGSGYFIDGDLDELDAPGEWMWEDGTLYLYPPAGSNPETMTVEVVVREDAGLSIRDATVRGLRWARFFGPALKLDGPSTVEDCLFEEIETDAVVFSWNSQPFAIRRSIFRDVRNVAIQGWADPAAPPGTVIERNLFMRIGTERGYGGSGSWHAAGVILGRTAGGVFRLNRVVDTGYAGIILGSDGQTVERNIFVRTMSTLNDGAAVYTNCNASHIRENIILDTIGDLETSHPWWPLGHGIWPEFLSDFRDSVITDNTIYGSNGQGIFLPNNFSCDISGNLAVDNRVAGLGLSGDAGDRQEHTISGNLLAAVFPTRRLQRPENLNEWWKPPYAEPSPVALQYDPAVHYGRMSGTTFVASPGGAAVIRPEGENDIDSLAAWVAAAPWADATGSRVVRANAFLLFNDTECAASVPLPAGSWSFADGTPASGSVALAPFRGQVLVSDAPVQATPPYLAASGIDWRAEVPTLDVLLPGSCPDGGTDAGADAGPDGGGEVDQDVGPDAGPHGDLDAGADPGGDATGTIGGGCACGTPAGVSLAGLCLLLVGVAIRVCAFRKHCPRYGGRRRFVGDKEER